MSPFELTTLVTIDRLGQVDRWTLSREMTITVDYAGYLCKELLRRGYLEGEGGRRYRLAPTAHRIVLTELRRRKGSSWLHR